MLKRQGESKSRRLFSIMFNPDGPAPAEWDDRTMCRPNLPNSFPRPFSFASPLNQSCISSSICRTHLILQVLIGPNAVLAFAREGYSWFHISPKDLFEALSFPGLWKLAYKHWVFGLGSSPFIARKCIIRSTTHLLLFIFI